VSRLLVVEDNDPIGRVLSTSLRRQGYEVVWMPTGRAALNEMARCSFDLALLDLGLPDVDGVEIARRLRAEQPGCVLVMLTARQEEMDVVVGLEAGADDYLTKPFRLAELQARIRAHLRRGVRADAPDVHVLGDLVLDVAARRCVIAGQEVEWRTREFDLLTRLVLEAGRAVSRDRLISDVWDENWFGSTKTLDVHVAAIRRRLAAIETTQDRARIPQIATLRGFGYRLDLPPEL
jgi:DNA-binding response OmpR family regulator